MRLLEIRFRGQAIERGRLPVAHLASFLDSWRKVVQRTGRVLRGEARSVRPGQPPQDLRSELEFELVTFDGEGDSVSLGLERRLENTSFPEMDFGLKVIHSAIGGLREIRSSDPAEALPNGIDPGVLRAWRDAGVLLGQGVETIKFTLNDSSGTVRSALDPDVLERIRERLTRPSVNIRKIEGRLLMVDFTGKEARCRIHPIDGEPIECLVDEERKEMVLANMLEDVLITGEVRLDPATGRIRSITVQDIERRETPDTKASDDAPQPRGLPYDSESGG
ncbi:MAG: hypothetical protein F4222_12135 [Gammaproteobacteria bacterium]|nr:hypothetical protein [Gammaproteobacteria bacterium]MYF59797.1 hypothetical protein [Gammaproteobacteria bacterium]